VACCRQTFLLYPRRAEETNEEELQRMNLAKSNVVNDWEAVHTAVNNTAEERGKSKMRDPEMVEQLGME
jgi:hypothetical protein